MTLKTVDRIEVVDALRGIALFAIVIVHCLEHYNLYYIPDDYPQWLTSLDKGIWDTIWFIMAGKAFSTFSLLFGFSFYIQFRNAQKRGIPFKGRFVWRMFLLLMFSQLHSLFYNGDILLLYAVMGLFLVSVSHLSTRKILIIASFPLGISYYENIIITPVCQFDKSFRTFEELLTSLFFLSFFKLFS